jgi:hypothetical protein
LHAPKPYPERRSHFSPTLVQGRRVIGAAPGRLCAGTLAAVDSAIGR